MNGVTIPMALVDFVPVVLFLLTALLLMRDLYNKMSKGAFALFSAETLMIVAAGIYKASWKLLYALNVCNFVALNKVFFPMQTTGFVLTAMALVALLTVRQEGKALLAAAPVVYESNLVFVVLTVLGTAGICASLCVMAKRLKRGVALVLFLVAFVFMLAMGYLSSRDFQEASMNWIAQGTNIIAQGALFVGALLLHRAGLSAPDALKKGRRV